MLFSASVSGVWMPRITTFLSLKSFAIALYQGQLWMQLIQPKAMKWTTTTLSFRPFMVSGLVLTQAAMSSNSGAA